MLHVSGKHRGWLGGSGAQYREEAGWGGEGGGGGGGGSSGACMEGVGVGNIKDSIPSHLWQ